jgi:hypothetical protein
MYGWIDRDQPELPLTRADLETLHYHTLICFGGRFVQFSSAESWVRYSLPSASVVSSVLRCLVVL